MKKLQELTQKGDTIIEVMIVLAVLGLALGIAYSTANKSLINARQAQEYSEATAIAQSQIEKLRANSAITDTADSKYIYRTGTTFCIKPNGEVQVFSGATTPTECKLGNNSLYETSITYNANTFTVQATWDDVTGSDSNNLSMSYRMYKP